MTLFRDTYDKHGEALRYLFFGGINVLVTWSAYALLVLSGVNPTLSNALSWIIGVIFAFIVNKFYVFGSKSLALSLLAKELVAFMAARAVTGVIAILGFPILYAMGLNQAFMGVDGFIAKITVTMIEIALNYVFSKYYIFKKAPKIESSERAH
jgi:putative flippase GtrA